MAEVEKFSDWRTRAIFTEIADHGVDVFESAEGAAFIEQLHAYQVGQLREAARGWGYAICAEEVVQIIITNLLTTRKNPDSCPARYIAAAAEPWAYFHTTAIGWLQKEWGVRGAPLENVGYAEYTNLSATDRDEHDLTPLEDVVNLTFGSIAQVVDPRHHAVVRELLYWIAANPPQRLSYDADDRVAAHRHCPSLTIDQVVAVIKIARGSRPNTTATSLMGQFLLDASFRISDSGSHYRALTAFKNAFRAGEAGSRMLTDWV
ncbi:hypothetical protein [Leucobacter chromiiresistens]|uniref:Uncharacterized protein n=1 Tax=Leucobacter chromiiresistens TaxID=1079994 RepID=A0A1H0ZYS8_9MICO|nr:hypothetical protein [Leucobacter chromiiresistens]SDQ32543.1 hypothetical protein SAMN04488565_2184 [Leucobacter chromiiresistens]